MDNTENFPTMNENYYIWKPDWIVPYESAWGMANRFFYFNWIRPYDLIKVNKSSALDEPMPDTEKKTRRIFNPKLCVYNCPNALADALSTFLGIPEDHFMPFSGIANPGLSEYYQTHFTGNLKYCPECMRYGIHLIPHQLIYSDTCLVHGCKLKKHDHIKYNINASENSFPSTYWEHDFRDDFDLLPVVDMIRAIPVIKSTILEKAAFPDFISKTKRLEIMIFGNRCLNHIDPNRAEEQVSFLFDDVVKNISNQLIYFERNLTELNAYEREMIEYVRQHISSGTYVSKNVCSNIGRFVYKDIFKRITKGMPLDHIKKCTEALDDVLTGRKPAEILDSFRKSDLLSLSLFRNINTMKYYHEICDTDSLESQSISNRMYIGANKFDLSHFRKATDYPLECKEVPQNIRTSIKLLAEYFITGYIADNLMEQLIKDAESISYEDMIFRMDDVICSENRLPVFAVRIMDDRVSIFSIYRRE